MSQVAYKSWGLLPHDPEPPTTGLQISNTPMMTTVAMDEGASLVFELGSAISSLIVDSEVTTLSAESIQEDLFAVFTGDNEDSFHRLEGISWERNAEGLFVVFSARIPRSERYLKLHFEGSSLKDAVKWNRRRLPEGRSGSPGFDTAVWVDRFPELVDDLGDFWCHGHSSPVL